MPNQNNRLLLTLPPYKEICPDPKQGSKMLFFTGGSALRDTTKELISFTHNSTHLITPFDSGGSSAFLRNFFDMPAIGDLRSRIMALADTGEPGIDEILTLFAYRLPWDDPPQALQAELVRLVRGKHRLLRQIPNPMKDIIQEHLIWFALLCGNDFPLQGANIGNLILTAGYLRHKRRLNPVIALFSRMVHARGIARPIVDTNAHLVVRLENGQLLVGQHLFTGKENPAIASPISKLWFTTSQSASTPPSQFSISQRIAERIRAADVVFYPMGSFYSSIIANLLPRGVGAAISKNRAPKIFIPNLGTDPELLGLSLQDQIQRLVQTLQCDNPALQVNDLLTHILLDVNQGTYPGGIPYEWLQEQNIGVLHFPLVTPNTTPLASSHALCHALTQCAVLAHSLFPTQK